MDKPAPQIRPPKKLTKPDRPTVFYGMPLKFLDSSLGKAVSRSRSSIKIAQEFESIALTSSFNAVLDYGIFRTLNLLTAGV